MSNDQIALHDLIIHKIDHLNSSQPRLSDLRSPISEAVDIYLRDEIVLNREHEFSRSGSFITPPPTEKPSMKQLCNDLLGSERQFVQQSQKIAEHLFRSINNDGRIRPGDLVVCTFSENGGDKWLALLKMDPQDSFITAEEKVEGKRRLVLKQVRDVMPIGALQKCAFILPEALRKKRRDLIVLDQQQAHYGTTQVVASFFSKDFLQCEVGFTPAEATRAFMDASSAWIDSKKDEWDPADVQAFRDNLQTSLQRKTVSIVNFAQTTIEKPEDQTDYLDKVLGTLKARGFQDRVFRPPPNLATRPVILQLDGDEGLRVRIRSDAVGAGRTLNYQYDQATATWQIVINTMKLKETYK